MGQRPARPQPAKPCSVHLQPAPHLDTVGGGTFVKGVQEDVVCRLEVAVLVAQQQLVRCEVGGCTQALPQQQVACAQADEELDSGWEGGLRGVGGWMGGVCVKGWEEGQRPAGSPSIALSSFSVWPRAACAGAGAARRALRQPARRVSAQTKAAPACGAAEAGVTHHQQRGEQRARPEPRQCWDLPHGVDHAWQRTAGQHLLAHHPAMQQGSGRLRRLCRLPTRLQAANARHNCLYRELFS